MRMRWILTVPFVAIILGGGTAAHAGGGCLHGQPPSDGTGTRVEMVEVCFSPTVLHVNPGTEITFVNRDDTSHQVIGVGGTWGSWDELGLDDAVTYAFEANGVYPYACWLHPGMIGAMIVGDGSGNAGLDPASVQVVAGPNVSGGAATEPVAPAAPSATTDGNGLATLLAGLVVGAALGIGAGALTMRRRHAAAAIG